MKVKYAVLGAGPSGLAFADALKKNGETSFVVLEKERTAGGLCRSTVLDGAPFDFGGGHILDVRNAEARDYLFSYLPENEWNTFDRVTKIVVDGYEIDYPMEANIWQLPEALQREYLSSIAKAGCNNGLPMPERFTDWIAWKLGDKIAKSYMLPYNQKIFSCDLDTLGTYWLNKLPDVSYEEVISSCRAHRPFDRLPAHARFYYPKKYGYGEAFLRIAAGLSGHIEYGEPVTALDLPARRVNGTWEAETIVNTVPWDGIAASFPQEIRTEIDKLEHAGTDIDYFRDAPPTPAHWTYYADIGLSYHRIIHRCNLQPGAAGHWTETNAKRRKADAGGEYHFENEYTYPLNTISKPEAIRKVLGWAEENGVYGLGRWGEWEHFNSDVVISRAFALAKKLTAR